MITRNANYVKTYLLKLRITMDSEEIRVIIFMDSEEIRVRTHLAHAGAVIDREGSNIFSSHFSKEIWRVGGE